MVHQPSPTYRFGDLLARATQGWLNEMARRLEILGYTDYRRSDAAAIRHLANNPLAIGELGAALGVTRQAARKVADGLERRGLASTDRDPNDARQLNVTLSDLGHAYARAVIQVIDELNTELIDQVDPEQLRAADKVLRAAIADTELRDRVRRTIPPPH
jgi:DNA-binding MarR family transcriptional regulator